MYSNGSMQAGKSATSDVITPLQVEYMGFLMRKSFYPFVGPTQIQKGEYTQNIVVGKTIQMENRG